MRMLKGFCHGFKDQKDGQVTQFDVHGEPDTRDFKHKECVIIVADDFKAGAEIGTIDEIKANQDKIIALAMKNDELLEDIMNKEDVKDNLTGEEAPIGKIHGLDEDGDPIVTISNEENEKYT